MVPHKVMLAAVPVEEAIPGDSGRNCEQRSQKRLVSLDQLTQ